MGYDHLPTSETLMPKSGSMRDLIKPTGELEAMQEIQVDAKRSLLGNDVPASIAAREIAVCAS